MIINGLNGNTLTIIEDELLYFVHNDNTLTFYFQNKQPHTLYYADRYTAQMEVFNLLRANKEFYKYLCNVPSVNNSVYFINVRKTTADSTIVTATISVLFGTQTITITTTNSTIGNALKDYINNKRYSFRFGRLAAAGVIHTVNPNFTLDTLNRRYPTIQDAITNATSGEFVIIQAGTYTITAAINLKNGVNCFAEKGAVLRTDSNINLIRDNGAAVTCKFCGYIELEHNCTNASGAVVTTNGTSNLFFEFDVAYGTNTLGLFYNSEGNYSISGYYAQNVQRVYDSDSQTSNPYNIIDILYQISTSGTVHFPDPLGTLTLIVLNGILSNSNAFLCDYYASTSPSVYYSNVLLISLNNNTVSGSDVGKCILSVFSQPYNFYFWNVSGFARRNRYYAVELVNSFDPSPCVLYTDVIANITKGSNLVLSGAGSYTQNNNFSIPPQVS